MTQFLTRLLTFFQTRIRDEETGATAVEYALIIGVIGVAVGAAALLLGGAITDAFTNVSNTITGN